MDDMTAEVKSSIFDDDDLQQASEYLRLALKKLGQHKSPATPVNYSLAYSYVSGKNVKVIDKMDAALKDSQPLDIETAESLYMQLFYNENLMNEHIRADLLTTVAQVIGALVDIAGKTNISNGKLENHIDSLAKSKDASDVLKSVSSIMNETRKFVTDSRKLEFDLNTSINDVSKLKEELATARREATIDSLTKLHNRGSFDQELIKLTSLNNASGVDFCIIFIDIDFFKKINDEHGHLVGDKVLNSLAQILKSKVRGSDFTARFGGEEFVILLPNTQITNAFSVAENIRSSIEKNRLILRKSKVPLGSITASFGVAGHRKGETVDDVISRCDAALYRAKKLGRNRTVIAD